MLRSRLSSLLATAAAVLSMTATGLALGTAPAQALTVRVIDGFGSAQPGGAARSTTDLGGTFTHSAGTTTLQIANGSASGPVALLEYQFTQPLALNSQGANALVFDHTLTSTDSSGNSGVSWSVTAGDSSGNTSTASGNARPGQPLSVMPLTYANGVGFSGNADMGAITGLLFEFYPISNTGGYTNTLILDQLYTRSDATQQSQSITFSSAAPTGPQVGDTYTVSATATSGLPVGFSVGSGTTNNACTILGSTVSFKHIGTCQIRADQAGNATWSPASGATQNITVTQGNESAITYTQDLRDGPVGDAYVPAGTGTRGGALVVFSVRPAGTTNNACVMEGTTLRYLHAGTCAVIATVTETADWSGGNIWRSVTVTRGDQSWASLPNPMPQTVGGTWTVPNITESKTGLPATVALAPAQAGCTLTNGVVSFQHVGSCVLQVTGTGSADWNAPAATTITLTAGTGSRTILVTQGLAAGKVGATTTLAAQGSAGGGTVSYSSTTPAVCSTSGATVTYDHPGQCKVTLTLPATTDWSGATTEVTAQVAQGTQSTQITTGLTSGLVGTSQTIVATGSHNPAPATVTLMPATTNNACTVSGSTVTFAHAGRCVVTVSAVGTTDHEAGNAISYDVVVSRGLQEIIVAAPPTAGPVGSTVPVSGVGSRSGVAAVVTLATTSTGCELANGVLTYAHVGTCQIRVTGGGNADWEDGEPLSFTAVISKGHQTVQVSPALADGPVGVTLPATATASGSGLPVAPSVGSGTTNQACTVVDGEVRLEHVGTCDIVFTGGGDDDWNDATRTVTLAVTKGSQDTTVTSGLSDAPVGSEFTPVARGTRTAAGATLSLDAATTNDACRVDGAVVHYQHVGVCVVKATAHGDADWNDGAAAELRAEVSQAAQTITFTSPAPTAPVYPATSFRPSTDAGGASGQPVVLDTVDAAVCSITDGTVSFHTSGTCTVRATQAGDDDHLDAPPSLLPIEVTAIPSTVAVSLDPGTTVITRPTTLRAAVTPALGEASGSVQFRVDGVVEGAPVPVVAGVASAPSSQSPAVGTHEVSATFLPTRPEVQAADQVGSTTWTVQPAATTTRVTVTRSKIIATVDVAAPARVALWGRVTFRVDGKVVGSRAVGPTGAELGHRVPAGKARSVSAHYSGYSSLLPSSGSTSRRDPVLKATISSSRGKTRGWYSRPVTVAFTCRANGAALVTSCPAPVTLRASKAAQRVTRTVRAADGGIATLTAGPINIDRVKPKVELVGVPRSVTGATPTVRCRATDRLSGIGSCRVSVKRTAARVTWTATARDKAGNTTVLRRTVAVATATPFSLSGVPSVGGVAQVKAGRTYTMVVLSTTRPQYVNAAVDPNQPAGHTVHFIRAGTVNGVPRWVLGVTFDRAMKGRTWQIGAQCGARLLTLKVRVS